MFPSVLDCVYLGIVNWTFQRLCSSRRSRFV